MINTKTIIYTIVSKDATLIDMPSLLLWMSINHLHHDFIDQCELERLYREKQYNVIYKGVDKSAMKEHEK